MKKLIITSLFLIALFSGKKSTGQDLPLYSQKLTNSFIYNPSVAGNSKGSLTLSHRRFWSGLDDASSSNLLSLHLPFAYDRFGAGINLFSEKVGIYDRLYFSGAFAYHVRFNDDNALSMGVSAEYNNFQINSTRLDVRDEGDQLLTGSDVTESNMDFSFGMSFKSRFFETGLAINRLNTGLGINGEESQLSEFYSAYIAGKLPLSGDKHVLEPIVTYRQLSTESNQIDAGLYYTFNDAITIGGGYRSGSQFTATAALKFANKFLVGYSYESFSSDFRANVGNSSEITLRIDFRDREYSTNTRNSRKIMTNSLAFRRKTLSRSASKARRTASSPSKSLKKRLRRNYTKSPNYRMNSSRKLHAKKVNRTQIQRRKNRRKAINRNKSRYKSKRRRR